MLSLEEICKEFRTGVRLILLHTHADIDAIGSASALALSFEPTKIGAVENISRETKNLDIFLPVEIDPDISKFDTILILDTASPELLGHYKSKLFSKNVFVVDHHEDTGAWKEFKYYCDSKKNSCAEIVYEMLNISGCTLSRRAALCLLVSILCETANFRYGSVESLKTFTNLAEQFEIGMNELQVLIGKLENHHADLSYKIAHLKAAQRTRFEVVNGFIIAGTLISAFESSVCKSLLQLGADVAFAAAQDKERFRVSVRAKANLLEKGLNLGKLMHAVAAELEGDGGGHSGAAGLMGTGDAEAALNICIAKCAEEILSFSKSGTNNTSN